VSPFHNTDFGLLPLLRPPLLSYIPSCFGIGIEAMCSVRQASGQSMNAYSAIGVVCLLGFAIPEVSKAQQSPAAGIEQLTQWTMEDIARQRAKVREQDAEEEARHRLPDLSAFGTPVDAPQRRSSRVRSSNEIHCTTINMGGGDSATDCF
jgi:hypothetical protein